MTNQSSITNDPAQYASDTLQRMDRTNGELQAILSREAGDINRVMRWLAETKRQPLLASERRGEGGSNDES